MLRRLLLLALVVGVVVWFGERRSKRPSRIAAAAEEGFLLVGNGAEPATLDLHVATGVPENVIISALFEGLVAYHPSDDYENPPGVAESWETEDFIKWTFHLRPDARWSNGDPLTAADFVFSYRRMLTPELGGEYAMILHVMEGAEQFNKGETDDFSTVGVKAIDAHTLEIQLVGPTPYFPSLLKHYTWFPVHRGCIEAAGEITDQKSRWTRPGKLVGNGPFTLKTWRFDAMIEVVKSDTYWDKESVSLNGIRFFPIASDTTEERAFRDGQLHVTNTLPIDRIAYYREEAPEYYWTGAQLTTYFYRVNTKANPALADVRVRQALALTIDRQSIVESVTKGGQRPAHGLVPPSEGGPYTTPDLLRFDPDAGRAKLAEAGFPDGEGFPRLTILFNTHESHKLIAQAVQAMWKKHLGIEVELLNQDWQVYLDSCGKGNFEIARAAWNGDYMDPSTFLHMWMKDDGNNQTGWSSPEYDGLLRKAGNTKDPSERYGLLQQAETIFLNEVPAIPIYWYATNRVVSTDVEGWHHKLLDNHPYKALRFRSVEAATPNPEDDKQ